MKLRTLKMPLGVMAVLLGLSSTAHAEDIIVCESLPGLNDILGYMTFTNEEKDRPSLQGKLLEAQEKIDENKLCDAGLKVSDFNKKLYALATARKTKVSDSLSGEAIRCALEGSKALADTWRTGCESASKPPGGKGPKTK